MLNPNKAFSSFSVNDIQKAREFYGKTLGVEVSSGPEGTLVLAGGKALMYPKPNHQPPLSPSSTSPWTASKKQSTNSTSAACGLKSITNRI
jgi:catechol 2,3-dioxygenase-like lactoylglutathione lyase family enzyme